MIEGSTQIAHLTFRVGDGDLAIFVPGGEGNSEIISEETIEKLKFLTLLCETHRKQYQRVLNDRMFSPGVGLREFVETNVWEPGARSPRVETDTAKASRMYPEGWDS